MIVTSKRMKGSIEILFQRIYFSDGMYGDEFLNIIIEKVFGYKFVNNSILQKHQIKYKYYCNIFVIFEYLKCFE